MTSVTYKPTQLSISMGRISENIEKNNSSLAQEMRGKHEHFS